MYKFFVYNNFFLIARFLKDVSEVLKNGTKWMKIVEMIHSFILKSLKKFGLNSLTHSKVIALLLIFTKFTSDLMKVHHLMYIVDEKQVKNGAMSFKISAFRNNVAKLHLHSLHR
jgi:hypothetical protein